MLLDLEETPIVGLIQINGRLTFDQTKNINFRAKHIFVRAGELIIGNATHPYEKEGRITLYGEKDSKAIVFDNAIEAGNKLIANVGKVQMYGKKRTKESQLTRLVKETAKGDTTIHVATGLDWVAGDLIGILPTSFNQLASDEGEISAYDAATGIATLTAPLKYYHFGQAKSTGKDYNGLDMRGEVMLLSRNIKISGEDIESWGAQFVTSDTSEFDLVNDMIINRLGQTLLDNVEFKNCSQIDTQKAAIRFENAQGKWSSVTNSAFHHGYGWGINVKSSANLHFENNNVFFFGPIGVSIGGGANNITFDGNVVAHIQKRTTVEAGDAFQDKEGGFVTCTYFSESEVCSNIKVMNNIVAGAHWTGFTAYAHECGSYTSNTFKNNVAHSIAGSSGGTGAIIVPDRSSST
jgi:hypothetical protein